jgi:hypothetical protein
VVLVSLKSEEEKLTFFPPHQPNLRSKPPHLLCPDLCAPNPRMSNLDSSSAAEVPLAPGFRFHPTDEELVSYYLRRRVAGRRLRVDAIAEVDLYRLEPWELPSLSRIRSRDAQWYFFARLDRKITGAGAGGRGGPGNRTNRATPQGYWKTTGKDREVFHRGKPVGMKKTLVFHSGRAPKGARTNWVMHEYRLLDADGPQVHIPFRASLFACLLYTPVNFMLYANSCTY